MPVADQIRGGEGNGADVVAVDQNQEERPDQKLDLKRPETPFIEEAGNGNDSLVRHGFSSPGCLFFWCLHTYVTAKAMKSDGSVIRNAIAGTDFAVQSRL
jgi:hypothetical protein